MVPETINIFYEQPPQMWVGFDEEEKWLAVVPTYVSCASSRRIYVVLYV